MQPTKVLVTGADGFIGSHLCERLLHDGHQVRALVYYNSLGTWGWLDALDPALKGEIEVVMGDVRDPALVDQAVSGREVVLHLAALIGIPYSYVAANSYIQTNVTGTLNVLEAARRHGIRHMVHTSTSEVYGTAQFVPITESHPLSAQSPYAATKIAADQLALSYFYSFDTPITVLRPFNTYGPRQSSRAVIPTIILQALRGDTVVSLGSVHPTRDFNFVKDIVAAFSIAARLESPLGRVVNLGSNFEISIREVVDVVSEATGTTLEVAEDTSRVRPAGSEVDRLWADNALAATLLSWSPEYAGLKGFKQGISETVEWFADPINTKSYRPGRYAI
jgi:NAD dependent epimerase/dehydratase